MAGARPHPVSRTLGARPSGAGRRRLDALVPHTQATRRVRTCALLAAVAITTSAMADVLTEPGGGEAAATDRTGPAAPSGPPPAVPPATGLPPVMTRVETTDPVVFLTIDDGVTRTPDVAAALADLGEPVTFFLVDDPVVRDAGFFRAVPGAVVEGHTRTHADMPTLSEPHQVEEICGNADVLASAFGRRPVLFRPPYGNYDDTTRRAAAACGMAAIALWDVTVDQGTMRFRYAPRLRPGDIILLHFRPELPQELRMVARRVEQAGLRFALLEDYI